MLDYKIKDERIRKTTQLHYITSKESFSQEFDVEEGRDYVMVLKSERCYSEEELDNILTPIKVPGTIEQLNALKLKDFLHGMRTINKINGEGITDEPEYSSIGALEAHKEELIEEFGYYYPDLDL